MPCFGLAIVTQHRQTLVAVHLEAPEKHSNVMTSSSSTLWLGKVSELSYQIAIQLTSGTGNLGQTSGWGLTLGVSHIC